MREKILKGGKSILLRQLLSLPINAIGVAIVSRFLSSVDFGIQAILIPMTSLALMFSDFGTTQGLIQCKNKLNPNVFKKVQVIKFAGGAFSVFLFALLSPFLINTFSLPESYSFIFPLCGIVGWIQGQRDYQSILLQRSVDWKKIVQVEMMEILIYNVVLVLMAYFLKSAWCFLVALGFRGLTGAMFFKMVSHHCYQEEGFENVKIINVLKYGIPLQLTALFAVLNGAVNPVILGGLVGIYSVGIVNWSSYIVSLPNIPLRPLPAFFFSVLAERNRRDKNDSEIISDMAYWGMFFLSSFSLAVALILEFLINYVFGVKWYPAMHVTFILILGNVIYFPIMISVAYLTANGHSKHWLYVNMAGSAFLWMFSWIGSMYFKEIGYAVGCVLAPFISLFILEIIVRKKMKVTLNLSQVLYMMLAVGSSVFGIEFLMKNFDFPVLLKTLFGLPLGMFVFIILMFPSLYHRKNSFFKLLNLIFKKKSDVVFYNLAH